MIHVLQSHVAVSQDHAVHNHAVLQHVHQNTMTTAVTNSCQKVLAKGDSPFAYALQVGIAIHICLRKSVIQFASAYESHNKT